MTKQQVNEKIAGWFEPKPDKPQDPYLSHGRSPKGWWYWKRDERVWIVYRDVYTSEEANARLLKWLVDRQDYDDGVKIWARHNDSYDGKTVYGTSIEGYVTQEAESIKEAIVLAFLVVSGIEVNPL